MRWLNKPLGLIFALIFAVAIGVSLSPLERPHPATAQGQAGPAQINQNAGVCSGIAGDMFGFYFSANPVHYTATFNRNGSVGLCPQPTGPAGGGNFIAYGNIQTTNGIFIGNGSGLTNIVTAVSPGPNITVAGTMANPVITLASPIPTALASNCWGGDVNNLLQTFPCPGGAPTPSAAASFIGWIGTQWFGAATITPYPTPIPTCATTNCSFAGYTLTVPNPAVTCAGTTCSFAGLVLTVPTQVQHAYIVMTLPTTLASTGATTFPVAIDPYWTNIQTEGGQSGCSVAGTGTPETFVFLQSASFGGTYVMAAPTTFVLATGNAQGVVETIAPTAFVSPTPNGGFIVAKVLAQNGSTARSGTCTYTILLSHT